MHALEIICCTFDRWLGTHYRSDHSAITVCSRGTLMIQLFSYSIHVFHSSARDPFSLTDNQYIISVSLFSSSKFSNFLLASFSDEELICWNETGARLDRYR